MATGNRDTLSLVMLTGWDATELENYTLQDGTTFATVAAQMNAALGAFNAEIANHPLYSQLVSYTDQPSTEYRVGSSNGFQKHTEYGRPDMARADTEGHMIPLDAFDRGLGWTWDYLRKARMSQIEADIADAIQDARDKYRTQILGRLLQRGDTAVGSAGYSPGFATTAASTSVDFTPPSFGGNTFDNTHEHYVGIAGGVHTLAVFTDMRNELREHGHEPGYNYITGSTEQDAIEALTGFTPVQEANIRYGALQDLAAFSEDSVAAGVYPIGILKGFTIWIAAGMPQYYGFGWKSYGANSQRNPLVVRLEKGMTSPSVMAYPDNSAPGPAQPLKGLYLFTEFGVGVQDRTNGTARYVNNTTWADGTVS